MNASSKIEIIAYMTAPTGEDPAVDFVSGTALTIATIASGSASILATANLSTFGGYLRIVVLGTRVTSGNCSADLVVAAVPHARAGIPHWPETSARPEVQAILARNVHRKGPTEAMFYAGRRRGTIATWHAIDRATACGPSRKLDECWPRRDEAV